MPDQFNQAPTIVEGINFTDDRGVLLANNNFQLEGYKRFYVVKNHRINFVRAWHGHKYETKALICVRGAFKVGAVQVDDFGNPDREKKVSNFVLSHNSSNILIIPKGYFNGHMSLTDDAELLIFSNKTLQESVSDDFRLPYNYWNNWEISQR